MGVIVLKELFEILVKGFAIFFVPSGVVFSRLGIAIFSGRKNSIFYIVLIVGGELREEDALPGEESLVGVPLDQSERVKFQHPVFVSSHIGVHHLVV